MITGSQADLYTWWAAWDDLLLTCCCWVEHIVGVQGVTAASVALDGIQLVARTLLISCCLTCMACLLSSAPALHNPSPAWQTVIDTATLTCAAGFAQDTGARFADCDSLAQSLQAASR
jgi:hypothetical protein